MRGYKDRILVLYNRWLDRKNYYYNFDEKINKELIKREEIQRIFKEKENFTKFKKKFAGYNKELNITENSDIEK